MKDIIARLKRSQPLITNGTDHGRITEVRITETANGHPCIHLEIQTDRNGALAKRYHPTTPAATKHMKAELASIGFILQTWDDLTYLSEAITGSLVDLQIRDGRSTIFLRGNHGA